MNLQNIFNDLQAADPEFGERISPRRNLIKNMGRVASLAAVPLAFGSLLKKAYGKSTGIIDETLNFALTLEYLEYYFYEEAVDSGIVPSGPATQAFNVIRNHEQAHVAFLTAAISSLPATPVTFTASQFDFTAGGQFANVFTNYQTLLAVAQTFEDTGVRAYKGQAENLMGNDTILQAALQIHSVEARHAAHIRAMRGDKPWITGSTPPVAAVQASYDGEQMQTQAGVTLVGGDISVDDVTQAFDEPLSKAAVTNIITPFFA